MKSTLLTTLALAPLAVMASEKVKPVKPNIIIILADDLGYGDVGCYNAESKVATPNLDRLARQGMRFTDAHSPSTVSTPSRYSLLTGRMAFRIPYKGVFAGVGGPCLIKEDQLTLPQMLRNQGYATAMTGKWHVGLSFFDKDGQRITQGGVEGVKMIDYSRAIPDSPVHRGFDRFFGTACCPATDFLYAFIDGDRIPMPPTGMLDKSKLPKHPYSEDNRNGMIAPGYDLEKLDMVILQKSLQFLDEHAKSHPEQPFFLFHSMNAVHLPSFPSKQFQGSTKAGPHGDFIHELDYVVGELMKALERLGMADNTVVMFSSDNGPEVTSVVHMRADYGHDGARPWRGIKRDQWEGGHRVPFIVRWPGKIASGSTSDQTVCLTDIMATCAAMTGAALPGNAAEDSFDILPLLLGKAGGDMVRPYTLHQTISLALAIRKGPWKYLDHRGSGGNNYNNPDLKPFILPDNAPDAPGQLYNLESDPGETMNLYFKHPEIVRELKALLESSKAQGNSVLKAATAISAEQWTVFETSFISERKYNNPFTEVEVDVLFRSGDRQWLVPAFWAGGDWWTVRFAPPLQGQYTYRVECIDKANFGLNGKEQTLSVIAYKGDNPLLKHGFVKSIPGKSYFVHEDGTPFLWLADTWWKNLCKRMTWEGFQELTADRKAKGFSVVQIVCGPYPDENFFAPSLENEGGQPYLAKDMSVVNPKYFEYADRRFKHLVDAGIVPAIVGAWGRGDCNSMEAFGAAGNTYGAAGIWHAGVEGDHGNWGAWDRQPYEWTTWKEGMNYPGSTQLGTGKKLLEQYPWSRFEPHSEWVENNCFAVSNYRGLFDRVRLELPSTDNSFLPTDKRMAGLAAASDPSLASLCYHFGRYLLISSSRPGTEPANLQGIWNDYMNPSWDSKYTTNINTQMNYWPAESGNLPECAEPLIRMVRELTDQGTQVAREHYGARGWVFHQNTDIWRVAAPMDGPTWGTFTVGGAWLTTHLWEHYLYTMDRDYLREIYPVIKGSVEFFMDFLVEHPNGKWLVTNPSNSPENPPKGPGYQYFYDEVTGMFYFTTICYASSIDMQILTDLFGYFTEAAKILDTDNEFAGKVAAARARLVPPQIGKNGNLQEWAEDYGQMEDKHRHFSHLYGLYPGNVLSAKRTPELVDAVKVVLEQRGDDGPGFSMSWKTSLWSRLYDGERAYKIFKGYIREQAFPQLFAKCGNSLLVEGSLGMAAAITEMLMQSHEGVIDLLPALPNEWATGSFTGVCARGAFELDMNWKDGKLASVGVLSKGGQTCRIKTGLKATVKSDGRSIKFKQLPDGAIEFATKKGGTYQITA